MFPGMDKSGPGTTLIGQKYCQTPPGRVSKMQSPCGRGFPKLTNGQCVDDCRVEKGGEAMSDKAVVMPKLFQWVIATWIPEPGTGRGFLMTVMVVSQNLSTC
jgi:hypothetical protein